jgi:WD40 repeat protein
MMMMVMWRRTAQRVNCLAFNEDSAVLVSGSYDKTVKIWFARAIHTSLDALCAGGGGGGGLM